MKKKIICEGMSGCVLSDLEAWMREKGEKPYRAKQVLEWLYTKSLTTWDDMTSLPKTIRGELAKAFSLYSLSFDEMHEGASSRKYVFTTHDMHQIETVLIQAEKRRTVCVSTQVGCKYGCMFCASCKEGFVRNLSAGEIIDQVLLVQKECGEISNVVFMGMGEPLDNYEATLQAIKILMLPWGIGLGGRRITISTVGLVPAIERFAQDGYGQVRLSLSLHATTDAVRKKIMPIARTYSLKEVLAVMDRVRTQFHRDCTLEYIVIPHLNDSAHDMDRLSEIAQKLHAKVNLIGYNPIAECSWDIPTRAHMEALHNRLNSKGVRVTVRYSAGTDITAACGQLRRSGGVKRKKIGYSDEE